jgi:uncharacterized protein (TIGR02246 family)
VSTTTSGGTKSNDETQVRVLYQAWLDNWNQRDANKLAALCADDGNIIGFDGSQMNGRSEVGATIGKIFADHQTAEYIGIVREVRLLSPEVAVLRAVVGMVPRGQSDINPATNAIQTLIAVKQQAKWRIAVFQNTPAAFHGRPDLSQQLTEELRNALRASAREKRS